MIELVRPAEPVAIRVVLFDGGSFRTGKTVNLCIERLSDHKWWDGDSWEDTVQTFAMTESSVEDANYEGVYEYEFTPGSSEDEYDWSVVFVDTDGWTAVRKGRINARAGVPPTIDGVPLNTWFKAMLAVLLNKTQEGVAANIIEFLDRAGTAVVVRVTYGDDDGIREGSEIV